MTSAVTPAAPPPQKVAELRYLFAYLKPYRPRFVAAMLASMVSMLFGTLFPWLVGMLVDSSVAPTAATPTLALRLSVNAIALILLGTLVVQAVLTFFSSLSFNSVGERAVVDIRTQLFTRLVHLPMHFYGERRVGELSSRFASDLAHIQDLFAYAVPQAIRQGMLMLGGVAAIVITSWKLSLIMVGSLPPVILVAIWFGKKVRKASREAQDRLAEAATIVEETFQNISSVKAFTNERFEAQRYASVLERFLGVVLPAAKYRAALIAFVIVGIFGSITLVLWFGARLMQAHELSHGQLTRFTLFTLLIGGSVASAADLFSTINRTAGSSERVRELFREPMEPQGRGEVAPRVQGEVRVEGVHFAYPSRPELPVLKGVTLMARAGEKVALVGPSGAGKSTLVSLLLGFYHPQQGRITLDGQPLDQFDLAHLRGNCAIVPQEVLLFGGTIRENIAYGRPGASDAEVEAAARRSNCAEFIERFPEQYRTVVGDRGVQLSGGQRQRIAIARALLKDPAVLILDEATSSLDSESERLIQEALATLLEGRTAFIIAHRLSTIRQADRIYVLEGGRAEESGTHEELMAVPGGTYRKLSELQFSV